MYAASFGNQLYFTNSWSYINLKQPIGSFQYSSNFISMTLTSYNHLSCLLYLLTSTTCYLLALCPQYPHLQRAKPSPKERLWYLVTSQQLFYPRLKIEQSQFSQISLHMANVFIEIVNNGLRFYHLIYCNGFKHLNELKCIYFNIVNFELLHIII